MVTSFRPGLPHPDSPGEQKLYALRSLLPGFHFNLWVVRGVADLVNFEASVVVEVDGYRYHEGAGRKKAAEDKRRDRVRQQEGWTVLRFTSDEVTEDPYGVIHEITQAVRRVMDSRWREVEAARNQAAVMQMQKEASPRHQVASRVRRLGNWVQEVEGPEASKKFVRNFNCTLKDRYGPAADRTEDQWREALADVEDFEVKFRAKHGIGTRDLPGAWDRSCPLCHRFHGEDHPCWLVKR